MSNRVAAADDDEKLEATLHKLLDEWTQGDLIVGNHQVYLMMNKNVDKFTEYLEKFNQQNQLIPVLLYDKGIKNGK